LFILLPPCIHIVHKVEPKVTTNTMPDNLLAKSLSTTV